MIQRFHRILVTLTFTLRLALTLDNGLALTPPMGWLTWERFRCITDCQRYPSSCISEILIKEMSHHLVDDGYKDVGYEYIIIDDCWLANERDNNGRLQPDPERFPSGIAKLADYVHQLGLKFGIYEDFGVKTCGGYPGSEFYLELDAQTFADWGVDYVKFDGCNSDPSDMDFGYKTFGFYLNKTGRPMVYSCEWPLYQNLAGIKSDYAAIKDTCNLWRNHVDVQDNWNSVESIIRYYSEDHNNISMYAGPGAWNDPDMLVIGNYGLSYEQSRVQMAMWAIMASPLIMSTDLRFISDEEKQLLQNKNIIQINQDPLGVQGILVGRINGTVIEIWSRPLMKPTGSLAIALLQMDNTGAPTVVTVQAAELTLTNPTGYSLYEGFTGNKIFDIKGPSDTFEVLVNPNGVLLFTARPV